MDTSGLWRAVRRECSGGSTGGPGCFIRHAGDSDGDGLELSSALEWSKCVSLARNKRLSLFGEAWKTATHGGVSIRGTVFGSVLFVYVVVRRGGGRGYGGRGSLCCCRLLTFVSTEVMPYCTVFFSSLTRLSSSASSFGTKLIISITVNTLIADVQRYYRVGISIIIISALTVSLLPSLCFWYWCCCMFFPLLKFSSK